MSSKFREAYEGKREGDKTNAVGLADRMRIARETKEANLPGYIKRKVEGADDTITTMKKGMENRAKTNQYALPKK